MQTTWHKCPVAWKGQYKKGTDKPSIVLEGMADYHLYFWHVSYGYAGTLNDVNILNLSPLTDMMLNGELAKLEEVVTPYQIGEEEFHRFFILVDGMCPSHSRFIKSYKEPIGEEEKALTSWQEAARKDIERAFGVLQAKFQFLARPIVLHDLKLIEEVVTCCLILHNMCVADRVMDGDTGAKCNPANSLELEEAETAEYSAEFHHMRESQNNGSSTSTTVSEQSAAVVGGGLVDKAAGTLVTGRDRWRNPLDKDEHARLSNALKVYLADHCRRHKNNKR